MKKTSVFWTPALLATIIVFSLGASIAEAGAVSCGPEGSLGSTGYPYSYESTSSNCDPTFPIVYAYKDCIDQNSNSCRITWSENWYVAYQSYPSTTWGLYLCVAQNSGWYSNTDIVDGCQ